MNSNSYRKGSEATRGEKRPRKTPRRSNLQYAYRTYVWKGLGIAAIAGLTTLLAIRLQPELFAARSRLIIEPASSAGQSLWIDGGFDSSYPSINTHAAHITSSAFLEVFWDGLSDLAKQKAMKPFSDLEINPENGVNILRRAITATQINDSQLLEVEVSHPYSYVSKYLADELAKQYASYTREQLEKRTTSAKSDLEKLAFERRQNLLEAEKDLREFRKSSGLALTEGGDDFVSDRLSQTNSALLKAKIDILQLERTIENSIAAQEAGPDALLAFEPIKSNPIVRKLKFEGEQLRMELEEMSETYQRRHPKRVELVDAIAENRRLQEYEAKQIIDALHYDYNVAKEVEAGLLKEIETLERRTLSNAGALAQYDVLKRKLQAQQLAYDEVLGRLSNSHASTQNPPAPARVLDTAILPEKPDYPTSKQLFGYPLTAAALGFFLTPIFLMGGNTRFKIWDDIEEELGTRILGTLPQIQSKEPGAARYNRFLRNRKRRLPALNFHSVKNPQARESLSGLATQLLLGPFSRGSRVLLVTSHGENEGKSTTVFNLAQEFAKAGKRTLVIDCDLRRDVLSKSIEKSGAIDTAKGLSLADWFKTSSTRRDRAQLAICKSNTHEGMDFIPGGDGSEITSRLFLSQLFQRLIAKLKLPYDIILLDSPPAGAYSDALLLTTVADEVLFLIREGAGDKIGIKKTLHTIRSGHAHIAGVALNGLSRRQIQMIGTYYEREDGNKPPAGSDAA
ncbi:GumC family protein [Pelagicoccus albus]|uniref:non-specific protein-tyrosine kinase n=1 Tax=Pelagicoccus albus TaxID=415222 RepID=A0A7X1E8L5_9BACT|nr:AAA family ATPase [Pelagicoccus albus]MBC2606273.1 AAA family ATPase [Pelagicoccus albus]